MEDCKPIARLPVNFKISSNMSPSGEGERIEMSRVLCFDSGKFNVCHDMILRYIKRSIGVGLCNGGTNFSIKGYIYSDYAGDLNKSKSTTGYVFILASSVVSEVSKLQLVVAMSTTEAK
ncbi:Gag-Pol polyprotein [Cucumis melo var. makuwa]|uniref:Gag-Pol polyprotein n=1 Tax=Cucumis melo var. makuwa TaxID=1194695 RepID=A0A5D3C2I5_CUCMM|nr:Gag-Pol polyprotein [Cucumis melo var. makuwa]